MKEKFKKNLKSLSSREGLKYMFICYENKIREENGEAKINFEDYISYEIEHIIAQCYSNDSDKLKFADTDLINLDEAYQYIYNIGNITLAPKGWNNSWSDATYKQKAFLIDVNKKKISEVSKSFIYASYETSSLWIQKELITKYSPKPNRFLKENIDDRCKDIIDFACKNWSTKSF